MSIIYQSLADLMSKYHHIININMKVGQLTPPLHCSSHSTNQHAICGHKHAQMHIFYHQVSVKFIYLQCALNETNLLTPDRLSPCLALTQTRSDSDSA